MRTYLQRSAATLPPGLTCALVVLLLLTAVAIAAAAEAQGPPAVEVHGYMQTRYYVNTTVNATMDSETGVITEEQEDSSVETERISLSGLARLDGGRTAYAEIYIHPTLANSHESFLYLESCYLDIPAGPGAKFRVGKGRSLAFGIVPAYGNRKISNYSPLAETFTMDRALGIQYTQTRGRDSLAFGIFNSQRPGARLIGVAADSQSDLGSTAWTTVTHLTARDSPTRRSGELEASIRYGRQMGDTNMGFSARGGALDDTDAAYLAGKFGSAYTGNQTRIAYGVDATYKSAPVYGTLEYYVGSTGGIDHNGWSIQLGAEPKADGTGLLGGLASVCKGLFVHYGQLDIDVPAAIGNTVTWDTTQLSVSYVLPLNNRFGNLPKWIQFEYERNDEEAPGTASEIPNNLFFVELFTSF